MTIEHVITALVLILGLSLLGQLLSRWSHLPLSSVLVVLGFLTSELLVSSGIDTGLRAENFQSIIFFIFIPVLVFESAYNIDKKALRENIAIILSLAIVALMLCCAIAAVLLYYGIGHASGFPWIAALITGALLAATDPVAVVDKLKEVRAPKRLGVLLEGESLFNDATAIVIFSLFLSMAIASSSMGSVGEVFSIAGVLTEFSVIFFGGTVIGLIVGSVSGTIQRGIKSASTRGVMSLVVAYGSFLLAEHFMVSGVMSTL
jgi:CPA1 family monovalent cation:H+ antiporter